MAEFTDELENCFVEYLAMHGEQIKLVSANTELILTTEANETNNPRHINYDPPVIGPQRMDYVLFITKELQLRNFPLDGALELD